MNSKKQVPLSLRLSRELTNRLGACAAQAKQKKHTLAQLAIEAAVEAIERSGGYLVIPIQFEVSRVPSQRVKKIADEVLEELASDALASADQADLAQKTSENPSPSEGPRPPAPALPAPSASVHASPRAARSRKPQSPRREKI